jgi:dipeptidyl-peptidase 4
MRLLALLLVISCAAARHRSRAEPPAPPPPAATLDPALSIERVFGGAPIHAALPDWSWRPGHPELVRVVATKEREELVALSPENGNQRALLDLKSLEALVPERGPGEEGIGRGGPARLVWTPDGKAVCVLVKGERVWVDLATNARRRLTKGGPKRSDVQVSPDGKHLLYASKNPLYSSSDGDRDGGQRGLWAVATQTPSEPRLMTTGGDVGHDVLEGALDWLYPEELGLDHAAWWSPDSQWIAHLVLDETDVPRHRVLDLVGVPDQSDSMWYPRAGEKNPEAGVRVVPVAGPAAGMCWLDLGDPAPEYVVRVAWTPDSARVLVVTLDRAQRTLRLRSCNPGVGTGTTLFEEHDDAWIDPPPAPRFVDARTFLWRSAKGRWLRYRLSKDGDAVLEEPSAFTPEGFVCGDLLCRKVGYATGEVAGVEILMEGAIAGTRRDGIWRVVPGGVPAGWLAPSDGSLGASLDDSGSFALVRRSTVLRPPVLEVRRVADGALVRTLGDANTPAYEALDLPEIEEGAIPSDGGSILWRLWKPRALAPGRRYPVVVTVYGGPGSRTVEDRFGSGPYFPALLVQRGFLVLQVDGRGTGGQGPDFERKVVGRLGMLELVDQARAVKALAARPYVDGGRVGIFGWSYGGTMVVNALTRAPDVFRAGVAVAPVTDWRLYDTIYTERYMGLPATNEAGYDTTSAVKNVAAFRGGLLLMHGLADDNVHPQNTLRLVEALLAAKKEGFDWRLYPNRGHGIGGASRDVFGRVLEWFERTLERP